jgi:hypothetical protein
VNTARSTRSPPAQSAHWSGGETSSRSQAKRDGIAAPGVNAGLPSRIRSGAAGRRPLDRVAATGAKRSTNERGRGRGGRRVAARHDASVLSPAVRILAVHRPPSRAAARPVAARARRARRRRADARRGDDQRRLADPIGSAMMTWWPILRGPALAARHDLARRFGADCAQAASNSCGSARSASSREGGAPDVPTRDRLGTGPGLSRA